MTLDQQIAAMGRARVSMQVHRNAGVLVRSGHKLDDEIAALTAALATLRRSQWLVEALREVDKYSLVISSAVARCDSGNDAAVTAAIHKVRVALLPFSTFPDRKKPGT